MTVPTTQRPAADPTLVPTLPGPGEALRLMHVHAHPDDESSKGAASSVRYVHEGAQVLVVSCTGGERGDVLNKAAADLVAAEGMIPVRRAEMALAAEILGVQHAWLGFEDSGLPEGDPLPPLPAGCFADLPLAEVTEPLVRLMREFRPHVVTTYDEHGGYPHPDHIRCHEVTIAAWDAVADATRFPAAGEPWQPLKLYYHMTFHKARVMAIHEAMEGAGLISPYADWLERWEDREHDAERLTTLVPCAEFFPVRDEALRAHATQIAPESMWFTIPMELQQRVWPTEDYQLARSLVPSRIPENDLFAGLRGEADALVGGSATVGDSAATASTAGQATR